MIRDGCLDLPSESTFHCGFSAYTTEVVVNNGCGMLHLDGIKLLPRAILRIGVPEPTGVIYKQVLGR